MAAAQAANGGPGGHAPGHVVERFAQNGGLFTTVAGFVVAAALVVTWLVDREDVALWVPACGVLIAVLVWTTALRPRVWVEPGTLVLRGMVDTVRIPLAAVEEVAVQQVMAVRVGEKRYVSSGVGRTLRAAMKGSAAQRARQELGGLKAEPPTVVEPGMAYGDFVELRLRDLVAEDRTRRGVRAHSSDLDALAAEVERTPAFLEMTALVLAVAFVVFALLFG